MEKNIMDVILIKNPPGLNLDKSWTIDSIDDSKFLDDEVKLGRIWTNHVKR